MELQLLDKLLESLESVARRSKGNGQWSALEDNETIGELWKSMTGEIVKLESERRRLRRMLQSAAGTNLAGDLSLRIRSYEQRIDRCERGLDRMMRVRR